MQGFADLTLNGESYVKLSTTAIVEEISPGQSRGAQVLSTSHMFEVFPADVELPDPVFLDGCLSAGNIPGDLQGTMITEDRAVAAPTTETFVFKLKSRLSPQSGTGIFEGVRSSPPVSGNNGTIEFDFIEEFGAVIPVRAVWEVESTIGFN
jgi:hypothetical protein